MKTIIKTYLTIESPAFENGEFIPRAYSCEERNISPPLHIRDLPADAESLAVHMYDPDAPGVIFDHWLAWNLPCTNHIEEGTMAGVRGKNSRNENKYLGPCPPPGKAHHYHTKVYALDVVLNLTKQATKKEFLREIEDHIVASGEIVGLFRS